MSAEAIKDPARARLLVHPGPSNPVRIQSRHARAARHIRLSLQPGRSLLDALIGPLAQIGIENASTTILGGAFEAMTYCVAIPDPTGEAVVAYSDPIVAGPAYVIFGNATIGKNADGQPIVHCHAAMQLRDGTTKGGHILAQQAIVGRHPISVLVTSLEGIALRVAYDAETNISLIQPQQERVDE
ncbi:DUF296 domain-containing protein [soil metagenome]